MYESEKHTYYHTCPYCGANLDPQEQCDCQKITEQSEGIQTKTDTEEQHHEQNSET